MHVRERESFNIPFLDRFVFFIDRIEGGLGEKKSEKYFALEKVGFLKGFFTFELMFS